MDAFLDWWRDLLRAVRLLNHPDRFLKDSCLRAAREWRRAERRRLARIRVQTIHGLRTERLRRLRRERIAAFWRRVSWPAR
jgi:hypothetical protein